MNPNVQCTETGEPTYTCPIQDMMEANEDSDEVLEALQALLDGAPEVSVGSGAGGASRITMRLVD